MMPTIRLETVTKKNPKLTTSTPIRSLLTMVSPGICGRKAITVTSAMLPIITVLNERSFSVLKIESVPDPRFFNEATLSLNDEMIVGKVFRSVMNPPAATAPAPICRTYAR